MWRLPYFLIMGYRRLISPFLPSTCRFHPTCSAYGAEAFRRHGFFKGSWLTLKRLVRCHPWHPGGVDHVPGSPHAAGSDPENQGATGCSSLPSSPTNGDTAHG